jgi:hypothetical protein
MIAEDLWKLCLDRQIVLKAEHIAGMLNITADQASRMSLDRHEWKVHPKIFNFLNRIWGPFQLDLFASRTNSQLPRYYAWKPDPFSEGTDAFLQKWSKMKLWANPPWVLIPQILAKLIRDKASMTILVPMWPSAPWFPLLVKLLTHPPILINSPDVLCPMPQSQINPLRNPHWRLLACNISGLGVKAKAFHRRLSTFSLHQWSLILQDRFHRPYEYGQIGVRPGVSIPLLAI